ncbi:type VI secretion system-associated protein TagF [Rubellimicrobium arenae]|uniref:type VI secretion system-associated protein TagF n=1 Tax=Rubellimicrobium arenae TaxID=2817372 RepID=UPI001B30482B|nr:type VI secretion system-associated protein TagF [Rubellimicrobium arenae]
MSGADLSDAGYAGLFGKVPWTGDFVERGLAPEFRRSWDLWLTRHLAGPSVAWPAGGLRFQLASGSRTASGVIVPSRDSAGRRFPLSGLVVLPFAPDPAEVDRWCDDALPLLSPEDPTGRDADTLWQRLDALARPGGGGAPAVPLLLWANGQRPRAADPLRPDSVLAALVSSGGSSTP